MTDPCDSRGGSRDEPTEDRQPDAKATGAVASRGLSLETVADDGDWQAFGDVEGAVRAVAAVLGPWIAADGQPVLATVVLSSDASVARLNAAYRGKNKPTNVLSFPAGDTPAGVDVDPGEPRFLGDVILAAETVRAEADAQGIPLVHHLQHLVVHGVLHLAGLDHETEEAAEHMEGEEIEILARLGIANPYTDPISHNEETTPAR